ncbi:hypothetical protein HYPGJ_30752 [Hyphomicrobium sp. GJ21]|uniref:hypothetical protein n=1 Tax=Hyphomicrobium sp. GJ21 TaxID=113574 RepID=UPI000622C15F|nr:hypothetical protein [Hyphomicrobium sp. GJ21]CEJ86850.1 hypothetical protein HYPGJ_30752 [Hyphomicrobium sp. GJ21]
MNQAVMEFTFDREEVEATLGSLDSNADALLMLAEKVGRPELEGALRYVIQLLREHHATLRWHLGLPLTGKRMSLELIDGGAHG